MALLEHSIAKKSHQQGMSKTERRNHAKQIRANKLSQRVKDGSVFNSRCGAPRVVAIVPLCQGIDNEQVASALNSSVELEAPRVGAGPWTVQVPRFKQSIQYLLPGRDLMNCLDTCSVADYVLFVLSATEEVDELGEQTLRCIESQGVSTVLAGVHDLDAIETVKKRPEVLKSLKSYFNHFFAAQEKVYDLSSRQDCSNVVRSLCSTVPKGVKWRETRSWMVVDRTEWENGQAVLSGVVRGRGLKADRLVQVGEWGDFQIDEISAAATTVKAQRREAQEMSLDGAENAGSVLDRPTEDQDDLAVLAPEETVMEDFPATSLASSERKAVLLDDHHYFDEDQLDVIPRPKRLPRGTSQYQAAWYLGDVSDSGSDLEDVDEDMDGEIAGNEIIDARAEDRMLDSTDVDPMELEAPSEYPQSEMFDDRAPDEEAEELQAYRKRRRDDAQDDLDFPDEIELHPNVLAKDRLARYRGLKNFRTSHWDTEEDRPHEPQEWSRLLEIADYKSAKNRILKESLVGGVAPGTRVHIRLRTSSSQFAECQGLPPPTALFSLHRHEHKRTVMHTTISLPTEHDAPLKSKEELLLQCGPRRLLIRPLFSQLGNTPNNVHKLERYLHPGRTAVASFQAPVIWGSSVPCLYFRCGGTAPAAPAPPAALTLVATGTSLAASPARIIAKRATLAGHPFKIHKNLVTVRYMFFHAVDVAYFRALRLRTRRGRAGFIREALGTHGYFKATFDGKVDAMDAVAMSLYKRVWPRPAEAWRRGDVELGGEDAVDAMVVD